MAGNYHLDKMGSTQPTTTLAVGDSVVDTEDSDPDEAVVIERPSEMTIADWEHETDDGTTTAAAENPEYAPDEQLVVVVFRTALEDLIEDWQTLATDRLSKQVAEHGISRYGFPESRLKPIEPGELEAEWLDSLAERFADAGWKVTHNPTELLLKQYDEKYRITADGEVIGDGEYREPLENIVATER